MKEELTTVSPNAAEPLRCRRCTIAVNVDSVSGLCNRCQPKSAGGPREEDEFRYLDNRYKFGWEACGGGWRKKPMPRLS